MKKNILTTLLLAILAFLLLANANIYALKILMSQREAFDPNRTVTMYDKDFITGYYALDCKLPILPKLPDHKQHIISKYNKYAKSPSQLLKDYVVCRSSNASISF